MKDTFTMTHGLLLDGKFESVIPRPKKPGEWTLHHVARAYCQEKVRRQQDANSVAVATGVFGAVVAVVIFAISSSISAWSDVLGWMTIASGIFVASWFITWMLFGFLVMDGTGGFFLSATKKAREYEAQLQTAHEELTRLAGFLGGETSFLARIERSEVKRIAFEKAARLYFLWDQHKDDDDPTLREEAGQNKIKLDELHDLLVRFELVPDNGYRDYRSRAGQLAIQESNRDSSDMEGDLGEQ